MAKNRRRRPGENWTLWRVHGRDRHTKQDRATGYLVTDGRRGMPRVIAYAAGISAASLKRALAVRSFARGIKGVRDLSPIRGRKFPKQLLGMLLVPVDRLGRTISSDSTFAAGMYRRYPAQKAVNSNFRFRGGVAFELHGWDSQIVQAVLGKKEKRSLALTIAPQLGGVESGRQMAQVAA